MDKYTDLTKKYVEMINDALDGYIILNGEEYDVVKEAMLYALTSGGKRVRPTLTLEFCRLLGGDIHSAVPFACAVELIHCYSLIHDDLPCMDDDDMRRGKPSCHKKFDEATALLAGDALLTLAFEIIAGAALKGAVASDKCLRAIKVLASGAGVDGMVGGQVLDLINEDKEISESTLNLTHMKKTGSLIRAACKMGIIAAGGSEAQINQADEFGQCFGLAFQIKDDVLDATADVLTLGKPVGSDAKNDKVTYVTLYGVDQAKELARKTNDRALEILKNFDGSDYLQSVAKGVLNR